jgi:hypothetical protein
MGLEVLDVGFLEIIGEHFNKGAIGRVDVERQVPPDPPSPFAFVWLIGAGVVIALWTMMLWRVSATWSGFLVTMACSVAYVTIASRARPRPDYSNVGLLHGLIDHPFRYSDDYNRFLAFLILFFLPGRLIAIGLRRGLAPLRNR